MAVPALFDIPTLTLALAIVHVGSALFAGLLYMYRRSFPGARLWILGQCMLSVGAVGITAQSFGLALSTQALSNLSLLASIILMGNSLWLFQSGRGFPYWTYAALPAGLVAWYLLGGSGTMLRVAVFSGMLGTLSALVAAMLLSWRKTPSGNIYHLMSVYFVMVAAIGFSRAVGAAAGLAALTVPETGVLGGVEYMLGLLVAFFNLFGYFLLSSAKAERDLRAREDEIGRRNDELVGTIATKDALIAVIGHDLRVPVWSAARYVRGHLVEFDGDLNAKRESIRNLAEGIERISGLLDSLLEWALCASGRMKLDSVPVRLGEAAAEAAASLASTAAAKSVSIEPPMGDDVIAGDQRAMAAVFRNLLSNAVKYSSAGSSVRVVIDRKRDAPDDGWLIVAVEDDGVGMKPEQLEKLFVPGSTLLTLGTNQEQGYGFGLAISKLFIEAMGGSMRVESRLGVGTRFVLEFPIPGPDRREIFSHHP